MLADKGRYGRPIVYHFARRRTYVHTYTVQGPWTMPLATMTMKKSNAWFPISVHA